MEKSPEASPLLRVCSACGHKFSTMLNVCPRCEEPYLPPSGEKAAAPQKEKPKPAGARRRPGREGWSMPAWKGPSRRQMLGAAGAMMVLATGGIVVTMALRGRTRPLVRPPANAREAFLVDYIRRKGITYRPPGANQIVVRPLQAVEVTLLGTQLAETGGTTLVEDLEVGVRAVDAFFATRGRTFVEMARQGMLGMSAEDLQLMAAIVGQRTLKRRYRVRYERAGTEWEPVEAYLLDAGQAI